MTAISPAPRADRDGRLVAADLRPVISSGDVRRAADGKVGFHVDEFPELTAALAAP